MEKIAILFGSDTGNTETVASKIAAKIGEDKVDIFNVAELTNGHEVESYQNLILGTPTWGIGDLQDDWETFLPKLSGINLKGKTIALFGLGDCEAYPDSFVDGIGLIYEGLKGKEFKFIGQVATNGYNFDDSQSINDGNFLGLPLDEDNENDLTEERIDNWIKDIIPQFS